VSSALIGGSTGAHHQGVPLPRLKIRQPRWQPRAAGQPQGAAPRPPSTRLATALGHRRSRTEAPASRHGAQPRQTHDSLRAWAPTIACRKGSPPGTPRYRAWTPAVACRKGRPSNTRLTGSLGAGGRVPEGQWMVTVGPGSRSRSSSGSSAPISSARRSASSTSVSTMIDSGTVLMTLPLTKI